MLVQGALRLWRDDEGALLSIEWVFLATILVIGLTTGMVAVRNATNAELTQVADATSSLNQCFSFSGTANCASSTCGSQAAFVTQPPVQTVNTPAVATPTINVPVCPDVNPALGVAPAAANTGVVPAAVEAQPGRIRGAAATRPADCTDVEPGARDSNVRPISTPPMKKADDCTDREGTLKPASRPSDVLPASGKPDRKK